MTKLEAKAIVAVLLAAYPSAQVPRETVESFTVNLERFPQAHVASAARRITVSSRWFPSLAELLAETVRVTDGLPDPEEAWLSALRWQRAGFPQDAKPHLAVLAAIRASGSTHAMRTAPAHEWKRMFDAAYKGEHAAAFKRMLEETLPKIDHEIRKCLAAGMTPPPGLLPKSAGAES